MSEGHLDSNENTNIQQRASTTSIALIHRFFACCSFFQLWFLVIAYVILCLRQNAICQHNNLGCVMFFVARASLVNRTLKSRADRQTGKRVEAIRFQFITIEITMRTWTNRSRIASRCIECQGKRAFSAAERQTANDAFHHHTNRFLHSISLPPVMEKR